MNGWEVSLTSFPKGVFGDLKEVSGSVIYVTFPT